MDVPLCVSVSVCVCTHGCVYVHVCVTCHTPQSDDPMNKIFVLQVEELVDTGSVCHCDDRRVCSDHLDRPSSPDHAGML